jgi:hypothetical protein
MLIPSVSTDWATVAAHAQKRIDLISTGSQPSIFQRLTAFDPTAAQELEAAEKYLRIQKALDGIPWDLAKRIPESCRLLLEWLQVSNDMYRACAAGSSTSEASTP